MTTDLRFSLLGPLRASHAGQELDLGPARERTMLAVLLCRINEVMSGEELLDAVWDTSPPGSGTKVIPTYIYRLRKVMAPASDAVSLDSVRDGYVLRTDPDNLDVTAFAKAVTLAREPHDECHEETRAALVDALALWRGVPFSGLAGPVLAAERRRLEEQRLGLLEERFDLELRCGQHAQVIDELQALCSAHPWRERFAALLMIALYGCGRQADALNVYNDTRRALRESLGIDPGAELCAAHQAVLRSDDELVVPRATVPVGEGRGVRRDLPAAPRCLIGRHAEIERLTTAEPAGAGPRVLAVDGMAGVGKTALALRAAHELSHQHPDGQLYLDMQGYDIQGRDMQGRDIQGATGDGAEVDAAEALRRLLVAVGAPEVPATVAERASLWRSLLAERRVLLMLDNVARTEQVLPLLPGTDGCTVLVVGRRRLYGLPVTTTVTLDPLPAEGARRLLGQLLGERLLVDEPAAVSAVLTGCAGLPLAITRVAAGLRDRGGSALTGFAERLAADPLRALRAEEDSFGAVFAPCVAARDAAARAVLTVLGEIPREMPEIAAVLGCSRGETAEALQELLDAGLATMEGDGYRTHRLLAAYAATLAVGPVSAPIAGPGYHDLAEAYATVVARHRGMGQHQETALRQHIHRAV